MHAPMEQPFADERLVDLNLILSVWPSRPLDQSPE
jgi:hypothetical protein